MPRAGNGDLDDYLDALAPIADPIATVPPETQVSIRRFVGEVRQLPAVDRSALAELVEDEPDFVPIIAAVVGLSQERLKRQLQLHTGSPAWVQRARDNAGDLIALLDEEFGIVEAIENARWREYTLADVLIARASARAGAGAGIDAGRALEDQVEAAITDVGLPYETRTQFVGRSGQVGPADFAIPEGGPTCQIAIGVKGFDSTGSKLTAAVDEVRRMVNVRTPQQFLFAVVDGVGWHGRQGDLQRLVELLRQREIDGLFPISELAEFSDALRDAGIRVGLLER